jgi:ATP-dependent Clp protease ATP-binding subunit ClpA
MTDPTNYTPGLKAVLRQAMREAERLGHDGVGPEHLLLAILVRGGGLADQVLRGLGVDLIGLQKAVATGMDTGRQASGTDGQNDAETERVLESARTIAREMHICWLGTEHLLLALAARESPATARILGDFGVTFDRARQELAEAYELMEGILDPMEGEAP